MLYSVIKYSLVSNNIASMKPESRFHLLYTDFSFIDLNDIEYYTADISDYFISSFTIKILNRLSDSTM